MQMKPAYARRGPVNGIAHDRPSHLGAVHTQLMRAAGQWLKGKPSELRAAAHHFPGACGWHALGIRFHPPAACVVALGERNVDATFVRLGPTFDYCPVAFSDLALLKQLAEQSQCLAVATQHETARGVTVEPVRQRRWPRQTEA
jgi:hypothetical protein